MNIDITFEDYSCEELYCILELTCEERNLKLSEGVSNCVMPILSMARQSVDFGNGRYVRNILEKALLKQATRIIHSGKQFFTDIVLYPSTRRF